MRTTRITVKNRVNFGRFRLQSKHTDSPYQNSLTFLPCRTDRFVFFELLLFYITYGTPHELAHLSRRDIFPQSPADLVPLRNRFKTNYTWKKKKKTFISEQISQHACRRRNSKKTLFNIWRRIRPRQSATDKSAMSKVPYNLNVLYVNVTFTGILNAVRTFLCSRVRAGLAVLENIRKRFAVAVEIKISH